MLYVASEPCCLCDGKLSGKVTVSSSCQRNSIHHKLLTGGPCWRSVSVLLQVLKVRPRQQLQRIVNLWCTIVLAWSRTRTACLNVDREVLERASHPFQFFKHEH